MRTKYRSYRKSGASRLAVLLLCLPWPLWAADGDAPAAAEEYQIKAAYLYHLARFITWPEWAFADQGAAFSICILGRDPFQGNIDETISGETVGGRTIQIFRIEEAHKTHCHILFISQSEKRNVSGLLQNAANQPVLTVSDIDDFARNGGMVEFIKRENRVRLIIAPDDVEHASLKADANLLRIAEVLKR